MDPSIIAVVLLITGLATFTIYKRNSTKRAPYPPGPPPRFLLGNVFDFPKVEAYKVYNDWAKIYGDILHLEAFGTHIVILNSQEVAVDLLDKRSDIYSDRPVNALFEASGWPSWNTAVMPYGKGWRERRKLLQQYMTRDRMPRYEPAQVKGALQLVDNLTKSPKDFIHHVRTASTGSIMSVTYDYEVAAAGDPYVNLADGAIRDMSAATVYPGSEVINTIPILPYLPSWLPFQKRLAQTRKSAFDMKNLPFQKAREAAARGPTSGIVNEVIAKAEGDENQANLIRDVAGSLYIGGADTTPSSMGTFFLAIASNPRILQAAHAEIDRVTGGTRYPEFSDRPNLPYVDAIVREVFRCGLVLPFSLPHLSMADDVYNGYFIPKGSIVLTNMWGINNDERTYTNPLEFRPERHLTEDGQLIEGPGSTESPSFGHGRRKCPGRYLADTNLWIAIVYVLSAFDISLPKDLDPAELNDQPYIEGIIYQPKPFRCTIERRPKSLSYSSSL